MSQLHTTVDNIELKTNRLGSSADLTQMATWDDQKYPTAALLRNVINSHIPVAVGSVIITASATNPGQDADGPLPGHWELVDKSFKHEQVKLAANDWILPEFVTTRTSLSDGTIMRDGHTISLSLALTLEDMLSGRETLLGRIKLTSCGISEDAFYPLTRYNFTYVADDKNCIVCYTIDPSGDVIEQNIWSDTSIESISAGSVMTLDIIATVGYDKMLSEKCDRFYWKRTA